MFNRDELVGDIELEDVVLEDKRGVYLTHEELFKRREGIEVEEVEEEEVEEKEVEEKEVSREKIVDWAYRMLDWIQQCCVVAGDGRSRGKVVEVFKENASDIIIAFMVLVEEQHRPIVFETLKKVVKLWMKE